MAVGGTPLTSTAVVKSYRDFILQTTVTCCYALLISSININVKCEFLS